MITHDDELRPVVPNRRRKDADCDSTDERTDSKLPLTFLLAGEDDGFFKNCSVRCEPTEVLIRSDIEESRGIQFNGCRYTSPTNE